MKRKFRDYQEKLIQDLKDPELASAYLNVSLMDEDPRVFLLALKNVHDSIRQRRQAKDAIEG